MYILCETVFNLSVNKWHDCFEVLLSMRLKCLNNAHSTSYLHNCTLYNCYISCFLYTFLMGRDLNLIEGHKEMAFRYPDLRVNSHVTACYWQFYRNLIWIFKVTI